MSDKPTVVQALAAVMGEVQAVRKSDRNDQQNYSFRGIDAVVNAVGPAFRKHGVVAIPITTYAAVEHYTTSKGTPMRGITLTVNFRFYGPAGDYLDAQVCGEAADSGDKATSKAHSVAYRTLLLQALCIPTDEPDPDSQSHDRAQVAPGGSTSGAPTEGPAQPSPPAPSGGYTLPFGKHKGKTLPQVGAEDAAYLSWVATQMDAKSPTAQEAVGKVRAFLAGGEPPVRTSDPVDDIPFS